MGVSENWRLEESWDIQKKLNLALGACF